jgi:transposase-like protein
VFELKFTFRSLIELLIVFNTEQKCIEYLELVRWNNKPVSPFDAASTVYKCKNNIYKCKNTNKYFNVKTGILFECSKIPLQTWFIAIYLSTSDKKGVSSHQLARNLNITQTTAWFMLHRIRGCFKIKIDLLSNEVEVDETFIGGKNKNRPFKNKFKYKDGETDKSIVLGMLERGGNVVAKVIKNRESDTLTPIIKEYVKEGSSIFTDEHTGCIC